MNPQSSSPYHQSDEEIQEHLHQIQGEEGKAEYHDELVLLIGDQVIEHIPCNDGVHDADEGHAQGSQHIEDEDFSVGLIVSQKPFEHGGSPSEGFFLL